MASMGNVPHVANGSEGRRVTYPLRHAQWQKPIKISSTLRLESSMMSSSVLSRSMATDFGGASSGDGIPVAYLHRGWEGQQWRVGLASHHMAGIPARVPGREGRGLGGKNEE